MLTSIETFLGKFINSKNTNIAMLTCCLLYASFKTAERSFADIFQTILFVVTLFAFWVNRKYLIKDKVFLLTLLTLTIPLLSWINSLIQIPKYSEEAPRIGDISNFYFFIFISYWLKGKVKLVYLFWIFCVFGVLLTIVIHSNDFILDIISGLSGSRVDFNYVNANHSAALFGAAILGLLFYIQNMTLKIKKNKTLIFLLIPCLSLVVMLSILLIFTQSRQVWVAIPISIFLMFISHITLKKEPVNYRNTIILSMLFIAAIYSFSQIPEVKLRATSESYIVPSILTGDINKIPYSSIGVRVHLWNEGIEQFKENPILGLGHNAKELVITLSERLPAFVKSQFSHLHNGHLEILVNYGLLGYITFIMLFYLLIKSGKHYHESNEITIISVGLIGYFFIINFFESFFSFKSGLYIFNCISAGIYTFQLNHNLHEKTA